MIAAVEKVISLDPHLMNQPVEKIFAKDGRMRYRQPHVLIKVKHLDWQRVEMFHLDEYVGLPISHPAIFRKYLLDRLIHKVGIKRYHFLDGSDHPAEVVRRVGEAL